MFAVWRSGMIETFFYYEEKVLGFFLALPAFFIRSEFSNLFRTNIAGSYTFP